MCGQYIGGCSVHQGDIMSTSRGVSWVNWEMSSTLGGYQDECGGYHEYIRGCSVYRRDIMHEYNDWCLVHVSWYSPTVLNMPRCTHDIPCCNHGIPQCTEHPLMYSWYPSDVLNTPTNALMISPDVLMVSPNVLLVSLNCSHGIPRCTEQPPMYWKSNDVLKTHYTGWWLHHNQTEVMMFNNTKALEK